MESSVVEFYQDLYITAIQKLAFQLPNVLILETHHCGNTHRYALKCRSDFQDVLCRRYYVELVLASSAHQIQPA